MKHWDRYLHWRIDFFNEVRNQTDKKFKTIQTIPPAFYPPVELMTKDPKVIKHILKDNFDCWIRLSDFRGQIKDLFGNGIFVVNHGSSFPEEHEMWSFQRKTA